MSEVTLKQREDDRNGQPDTGDDLSSPVSAYADETIQSEAREGTDLVDPEINGWTVIDALAFFYAQYGKVRHARALYAALYAHFPDNSRYALGLANARLSCEDYEGCLKLASYLADGPRPSASVHFLMARAHHALGNAQQAQDAVARFLEQNEQQSHVPPIRGR
ncbi:hypothetical protein LPB41_01505 [Thalassospira sp. MA62]|nr:hypothetical protein [Thalassospira sp. MA62]